MNNLVRHIIGYTIGLAIQYLKMTEEKRLLKDFGQEYVDYKNSVSMIFPKMKAKQT